MTPFFPKKFMRFAHLLASFIRCTPAKLHRSQSLLFFGRPGPALSEGLLGDDFSGVMQRCVDLLGHQFQILNPIVEFVTIDMMNNFSRLQGAAKILFHHIAMLSDTTPIYADSSVSLNINVSRPLFSFIKALLGAIMSLADSYAVIVAREFLAASGAYQHRGRRSDGGFFGTQGKTTRAGASWFWNTFQTCGASVKFFLANRAIDVWHMCAP